MLKSTRKLVSLILVLLLLCSLAVAVSAASQDYSGRGANCFFSTFTTRSATSCSGVIDVSPINGIGFDDHILRVKLRVYNGFELVYDEEGTPSTEHATNAYNGSNTHIHVRYHINESQVHYENLR